MHGFAGKPFKILPLDSKTGKTTWNELWSKKGAYLHEYPWVLSVCGIRHFHLIGRKLPRCMNTIENPSSIQNNSIWWGFQKKYSYPYFKFLLYWISGGFWDIQKRSILIASSRIVEYAKLKPIYKILIWRKVRELRLVKNSEFQDIWYFEITETVLERSGRARGAPRSIGSS